MTTTPLSERLALQAAWESQPKVCEFRDALAIFAVENLLMFQAGDMSALLEFACLWIAERGPLPDSGLKCG